MKIITLCLATVFAGLAAGSALAAEGKPASNVGILLTDRTGTPLSLDERLDPQHDPRIEISVDGGSGTFRLNAFYYTWDKAHMDPGDGNATARFTIMQE